MVRDSVGDAGEEGGSGAEEEMGEVWQGKGEEVGEARAGRQGEGDGEVGAEEGKEEEEEKEGGRVGEPRAGR